MQLPYDVGISPTLGIRGMIACQDIACGVVIERCPVVKVAIKDLGHVTATILANYYFEWDKKYAVMTLGYGSLINHSFTPNAAYRWNYKHNQLVMYAIQPIKNGEEVTINYNGVPTDKTPLPPSWTDFHRGPDSDVK